MDPRCMTELWLSVTLIAIDAVLDAVRLVHAPVQVDAFWGTDLAGDHKLSAL